MFLFKCSASGPTALTNGRVRRGRHPMPAEPDCGCPFGPSGHTFGRMGSFTAGRRGQWGVEGWEMIASLPSR